MKRLLAAVVTATVTSLLCAPAAQAFTSDELAFLNDLTASDIISRDGNAEIVKSGWIICSILAQGYPRSTVARNIYLGSQDSNGSAGIDYRHAQAVVFYAESDLCPEVR